MFIVALLIIAENWEQPTSPFLVEKCLLKRKDIKLLTVVKNMLLREKRTLQNTT